ncbi:DUF3810 domain-containing protein [Aridibaculum aurantiacum]|uniref:DUF3810 domain-containing protein n=1 Tax=Aridibaculum aurantiacum TaxID=2810307 RepID=UPI001A97348A|nr:DUF3810 domain-containing protein [Aridibaculum aurantiacum]
MKGRIITNKTTFLAGLGLLILIILIKVATFFPGWIESFYSTGMYVYISRFYRIVFGWFPLSVGDLLYLTVMVYFAVKLYRLFLILRHKRWDLLKIKVGYTRPFFILATVYIIFNLSWGLNYNRLGIAHQLQLQPQEHTVPDLKAVTQVLVERLNTHRRSLGRVIKQRSYQTIFDQAHRSYQLAAAKYPFLSYETESVKRSIYGRAGIYLGFLGYYNPFTGESQLNLTQPKFMLPFVTCHEMAHQLGYASESEANFVGYLVAANSDQPIFQYSAYFDMFNYANNELLRLDSNLARTTYSKLDTLVKKDYKELREYYKKSDNLVEPIIKLFYDQYLKANQQVEGVHSYNEVVGWLIAYYKKYGTL